MSKQADAQVEFRNASNLTFKDISSEKYRRYDFFDQSIQIENPLKLHVSESGGHRVFDAQGVSHYIPTGWIHLQWEVKDNAPHFDF